MSDKPHSADYFGDSRDFWWNRDFLQLMSDRWALSAVRNVLDVGCGVGHWTRCLAPLLPPGCQITGIDRESRWVDEARKRSAETGAVSMSFCQGEAERLPFPDETFDMVTCQTFLIHMKDPVAVIREMIRVLTRGGLLVIVEPNNMASNVSGIELQQPISEVLSLLELQLRCERGKMNLGEGFNSLGPFVTGWLSELNVGQIESYLSDKTTVLLPPYASAQEQAVIRETIEKCQRGCWMWNREDTLRYYLNGGGSADAFEALWKSALAHQQALMESAGSGRLRTSFVPVCVLISGRKKRVSQQ